MNLAEPWIPIPGFAAYLVSDRGRIRKLGQDHPNARNHGFTADKKGYCRIRLRRDDGIFQTVYVHRLVATAFIPNPAGLPEVDHGDGDPGNNRKENLEWVTHAENIRRAIRRRGGHWMQGHHRRKLWKGVSMIDPVACTQSMFRSVDEAVRFLSQLQVTNGGEPLAYTQAAGNISRARGKAKLAYGFLWASRHVADIPAYIRNLKPHPYSALAPIQRSLIP